MKVLLALPLLACFAFAAETAKIEPPMPGYTVQDFQWDVEVHPGQPAKRYNGTIQQLHAQIKRDHPGWEPTPKPTDDETSLDIISKDKRKELDFTLKCGPGQFNWKYVTYGLLSEEIDYLRKLKEKPRNGPGPGTCGRVSCEWNQAIWWCNDAKTATELESFAMIADGAKKIRENCRYNHPDYDKVVGQAFHDKWNVIVRWDTSNC